MTNLLSVLNIFAGILFLKFHNCNVSEDNTLSQCKVIKDKVSSYSLSYCLISGLSGGGRLFFFLFFSKQSCIIIIHTLDHHISE